MRDDEDALIVCNPIDARYISENAPDLRDFLVITSILEPGHLMMIPEDEFIDYLFEVDRR